MSCEEANLDKNAKDYLEMFDWDNSGDANADEWFAGASAMMPEID